MSQTQHAGLASQEVDENGKGREKEGRQKKLDDTYQEGQKAMKRTKMLWNLHIKKGLSLAD